MSEITIVDVIDHCNKWSTQRMLVVDRMPEFKFSRQGKFLVGEDSGFFKFYHYEAPSRDWKAFARREFDIPMVDGSVIHAHGQWWDKVPCEWSDLTYRLGVSTIDDLSKCYVFAGAIHVDREMVDDWLMGNEPSNNYHKYDPQHPDNGTQTIVSPWGDRAMSANEL